MKIRRLTDVIGAEVEGVDLSGSVAAADLAAIKQAFTDHGVLIVRGQELDPNQNLMGNSKPRTTWATTPTDNAAAVAEVPLWRGCIGMTEVEQIDFWHACQRLA